MRAGGDLRGSNRNSQTLRRARFDPGGSYRHENVQPACAPCQNRQGALITRERRHQWLAWMEEAEAEGIAWDGVL